MQVPEQIESVQQHRVTSETPAEMHQNHQNVSWIALPQRSHPAVRAHISIINISVRSLARHLHHKATGLMRTFSRGRIRRLERGDFQISRADCEQLSTTQNTNREGIRTSDYIFVSSLAVWEDVYQRGPVG